MRRRPARTAPRPRDPSRSSQRRAVGEAAGLGRHVEGGSARPPVLKATTTRHLSLEHARVDPRLVGDVQVHRPPAAERSGSPAAASGAPRRARAPTPRRPCVPRGRTRSARPPSTRPGSRGGCRGLPRPAWRSRRRSRRAVMPRAVARKVNADFRAAIVAPGSFMKRGTSCRPRKVTSGVGVAVEVVAGQHHRHVAQRAALRERVADLEEEREVEERVDPGVDPVEARGAALVERDERGVAVEELPRPPAGPGTPS